MEKGSETDNGFGFGFGWGWGWGWPGGLDLDRRKVTRQSSARPQTFGHDFRL